MKTCTCNVLHASSHAKKNNNNNLFLHLFNLNFQAPGDALNAMRDSCPSSCHLPKKKKQTPQMDMALVGLMFCQMDIPVPFLMQQNSHKDSLHPFDYHPGNSVSLSSLSKFSSRDLFKWCKRIAGLGFRSMFEVLAPRV